MKHIFLSYSTEDSDYADWVESQLRSNDFIVWRDKSNLKGGEEWERMIEKALLDAWALVIIQTSSARERRWVRNEVEFAQNSSKVVIPILLEGDPWFGLSHLQYVDVRKNPEDELPDAFYAKLLEHVPDMELKYDISLNTADPSEKLTLIYHLRDIVRNPRSPKARTARKMLEHLRNDEDDLVFTAAEQALSSAKQLTTSDFNATLTKAKNAIEDTKKPSRKYHRKMLNIPNIIILLSILIVAIGFMLQSNRPGETSTDDNPSPTQTETENFPESVTVGGVEIEVRAGPGDDYDLLGIARNESLRVTGTTDDGEYYRVSYEGNDGWIRANSFVEFQGNITNIAVVNAPPTPLPTETNTPRPTRTPLPTATSIEAGAILIDEDFEDERAQGFTFDYGNWQYTTLEDNNVVLSSDQTDESDYSEMDLGLTSWENYEIEYRFRILEESRITTAPQVIVYFRHNGAMLPDAYVQSFLTGYGGEVLLATTTNGRGWARLVTQEFDIQQEEWYSVRVVADGTYLQVFVDDTLYIETDNDHAENGRISFQAGPRTHAQFDDIRVIALDSN